LRHEDARAGAIKKTQHDGSGQKRNRLRNWQVIFTRAFVLSRRFVSQPNDREEPAVIARIEIV
jgi:hypothetical protein